MKRHADRAVVITDAQRSQEDQLRTREIRYVLMMSIRLLSLVAAAIVVAVQPPLLWLWLALCAVGMILVPWLAVVLANDALPKERHRWRRPSGTSYRRVLDGHRARRMHPTIEVDWQSAGRTDARHSRGQDPRLRSEADTSHRPDHEPDSGG